MAAVPKSLQVDRYDLDKIADIIEGLVVIVILAVAR